ncbi:hypothetical protein NECAME_03987 [Necator americanus]|uniref:Uncharacterized protein n=1 Tax=Necator americanus TaxID=51031 RepID=W2SZR7_NECAM|nr:hypothetical protein NECAME_03987 [Necator americanus]ETN74501.1 hypothetical protein NECAME_03987 [Necator americanus]
MTKMKLPIVGNSVALPRCIQRFHFNPREPLRNRTRIWENDLYEMGQIETVLGIVKLSPYSFEKGRHCFLPSILYCVAQWLTLVAFEGIGLPGFESVKRTYKKGTEFFPNIISCNT